jgi:hypothetical protein
MGGVGQASRYGMTLARRISLGQKTTPCQRLSLRMQAFPSTVTPPPVEPHAAQNVSLMTRSSPPAPGFAAPTSARGR